MNIVIDCHLKAVISDILHLVLRSHSKKNSGKARSANFGLYYCG